MVLAALGDPELARLEAKAPAQLQQETLHVVEQRGLQLVLRVFRPVRQAREFKDVGIAQHVGDILHRLLLAGPLDHDALVGGQPRALVARLRQLDLWLVKIPGLARATDWGDAVALAKGACSGDLPSGGCVFFC